MKDKLICLSVVISAIAIFLTQIGFRENFSLMFVYSIVIGIIYSLLLKYEIDNYHGLNLNLILLIGYVMRMVYPSITMSFGAMNGEHYYYIFDKDITDYMFACVPWMNVYYMIFYYVFSRTTCNFSIDVAIKPLFRKYKVKPIAITLFFIGEIYNIIVYNIPAFLLINTLNIIFSNLSLLALLLLTFDAAYDSRNYFKRVLLFFFVAVAMTRAMFFGFYKVSIVMPFLCYLLYEFLRAKNLGRSLMSSSLIYIVPVFFLLTQFVIYPFMTIKRNLAGFDVSYYGTGGIATNNVSNMNIINEVFSGNYIKDEEKGNTFDRLNSVFNNTYFYRDVCINKRYNQEIAIDNLEMLIPRFLYPEKHTSRAGLMVNSYVSTGTTKNYMYANSFSNIGQFSSAYFIGGPVIAILFAILNGYILGFYYKFLLKNIKNLLSLVFLSSFFIVAFKAFEEVSDGGITRAVMIVYYMIAIKLTNFLFYRNKLQYVK